MSGGSSPSRKIESFFSAPLDQLRPVDAMPVAVFVFFSKSAHVLRIRDAGEPLTAEWIATKQVRGLQSVWIAEADRAVFEAYLNPTLSAAPAVNPVAAPEPAAADSAALTAPPEAAPAPSTVPAPPPGPADLPKEKAKTSDGALIRKTLNSATLTTDQKKEIVTETAKKMLHEAAGAKTRAEQIEADKKMRRTMQDVLTQASKDNPKPEVDEFTQAILDSVEDEDAKDLHHSVNTATYAVVLAMSFGKIEPDLVRDIALAGLLHDIGVCRVPIASVPIDSKSTKFGKGSEYEAHAADSVAVIQKIAPEISTRVHEVVLQHHEKFDGSGYPRGLKGFQLDDIAQLISMANVVDAFCGGKWDGTERTMSEAFASLEMMEKTRTFPEYFNPDVFGVVLAFIRREPVTRSMSKAAQVVSEQVQGVIGKKAA